MNIITLILILGFLCLITPFIAVKTPGLLLCAFFVTAMAILFSIHKSIYDDLPLYTPYETNVCETTGEYTLRHERYSTDIYYHYIKDGEVINSFDNIKKIAFTEDGGPSYVVERNYNIHGLRETAVDLYINEDEYMQVVKEYTLGSEATELENK